MSSDEFEDEFKQLGFSSEPTRDQTLKYFLSSFITASVPIYLYQTIFDMPLEENAILFLIVTLFSSYLITFAYHNIAFSLRNKLMSLRPKFITLASVSNEASSKGDKKAIARKKREEQERVTSSESIAFSILYNNLFFLLVVMILAFYIFPNMSGPYNYILSVSLAAGILSLSSAQEV